MTEEGGAVITERQLENGSRGRGEIYVKSEIMEREWDAHSEQTHIDAGRKEELSEDAITKKKRGKIQHSRLGNVTEEESARWRDLKRLKGQRGAQRPGA